MDGEANHNFHLRSKNRTLTRIRYSARKNWLIMPPMSFFGLRFSLGFSDESQLDYALPDRPVNTKVSSDIDPMARRIKDWQFATPAANSRELQFRARQHPANQCRPQSPNYISPPCVSCPPLRIPAWERVQSRPRSYVLIGRFWGQPTLATRAVAASDRPQEM